jgi:hypothetical protein
LVVQLGATPKQFGRDSGRWPAGAAVQRLRVGFTPRARFARFDSVASHDLFWLHRAWFHVRAWYLSPAGPDGADLSDWPARDW